MDVNLYGLIANIQDLNGEEAKEASFNYLNENRENPLFTDVLISFISSDSQDLTMKYLILSLLHENQQILNQNHSDFLFGLLQNQEINPNLVLPLTKVISRHFMTYFGSYSTINDINSKYYLYINTAYVIIKNELQECEQYIDALIGYLHEVNFPPVLQQDEQYESVRTLLKLIKIKGLDPNIISEFANRYFQENVNNGLIPNLKIISKLFQKAPNIPLIAYNFFLEYKDKSPHTDFNVINCLTHCASILYNFTIENADFDTKELRDACIFNMDCHEDFSDDASIDRFYELEFCDTKSSKSLQTWCINILENLLNRHPEEGQTLIDHALDLDKRFSALKMSYEFNMELTHEQLNILYDKLDEENIFELGAFILLALNVQINDDYINEFMKSESPYLQLYLIYAIQDKNELEKIENLVELIDRGIKLIKCFNSDAVEGHIDSLIRIFENDSILSRLFDHIEAFKCCFSELLEYSSGIGFCIQELTKLIFIILDFILRNANTSEHIEFACAILKSVAETALSNFSNDAVYSGILLYSYIMQNAEFILKHNPDQVADVLSGLYQAWMTLFTTSDDKYLSDLLFQFSEPVVSIFTSLLRYEQIVNIYEPILKALSNMNLIKQVGSILVHFLLNHNNETPTGSIILKLIMEKCPENFFFQIPSALAFIINQEGTVASFSSVDVNIFQEIVNYAIEVALNDEYPILQIDLRILIKFLTMYEYEFEYKGRMHNVLDIVLKLIYSKRQIDPLANISDSIRNSNDFKMLTNFFVYRDLTIDHQTYLQGSYIDFLIKSVYNHLRDGPYKMKLHVLISRLINNQL